jgi:RNA polymerase sigma-70 factor (ECF subfamily)
VSAAPLPQPGPHEHESQTLGELLYGKDTGQRTGKLVPEGDWSVLVQAIGRGDQLALHALFERAHRLVFTLLVRITGDRDTADELTVDVFHHVWRRAASYDPADGSVIGWIMNQARCRAIDRVRFEHRKKRNGAANGAAWPAGAAESHDGVHHEEQSRLLRDALQTLTPDERQAIETAFFSQLAYREVAERLGAPLGTIKTRIRSGLAKLRGALHTRRDAL